jgi:hypothetical protein
MINKIEFISFKHEIIEKYYNLIEVIAIIAKILIEDKVSK